MKENVVEEKKAYENLLRLNIRLLCEYKPEEVIDYVKKKYYPINICLDICKKYKVKNALAYLYNHSGLYVEALNTYIMLLNETYDQIINHNKGLVAAYAKYFRRVIKLCKTLTLIHNRVKAEEYWYLVFEHIKTILESKETAERLKNCVSECIRSFIKALIMHYDIEVMIKPIIEHCGELSIENFKEVFNESIISYTLQQKILNSAQEINKSQVTRGFNKLTKEKYKAITVKVNTCIKCKKEIEIKKNKRFLPFLCGHIYHYNCLKYSNRCEICLVIGKGILFHNNRMLTFNTINDRRK